MEFEVSAELVSIYLEDAREQLAVLDDVLLRLEREGSRPELLASVLGPLHTLKGNSDSLPATENPGLAAAWPPSTARWRGGPAPWPPAGAWPKPGSMKPA